MNIQVFSKSEQAFGQFNGGQIIENKPIGFPQDGGALKPYSNLFYWAFAEAQEDSTIGLHPHQGFEIMSFVLHGAIRHYDTKLQEWRPLKAGDAQVIRAGSGISHAEFMAKNAAMFQIWIDPDLSKTTAKSASYNDYKAAEFPVIQEEGITIKTYIGADSPFKIDAQEIGIQEISFQKADYCKKIDRERVYSIYVLEGNLKLNEREVTNDDFVLLSDASDLKIESDEAGKLFVIASPKKAAYKTYGEKMQERANGRE